MSKYNYSDFERQLNMVLAHPVSYTHLDVYKRQVLHDVLGIGVSGQSADASVLRQISERNIQAEIFARKLVNRRTACLLYTSYRGPYTLMAA